MSEIVNLENQVLKQCVRCKCNILLETYFSKNRKGVYNQTCDPCRKKRKEKRQNMNPEEKKIFLEKDRLKQNERYHKNHEMKLKQQKQYRDDNPELIAKHRKKWNDEHRDLKNQRHGVYTKLRIQIDPVFKLKLNLRTRLYKAIKGNLKAAKTMDLLGCSGEELKIYLENKFTEGMTWENHTPTGWHVDHIKPCAAFNLLDPEEQRKCFHYTNLQPLWAIDNLIKGATYTQAE